MKGTQGKSLFLTLWDMYQKATNEKIDYYKNFSKGSQFHKTFILSIIMVLDMFWFYINQPWQMNEFPPEVATKLEWLRETYQKEGIVDLLEKHQKDTRPKKCDNPTCKNIEPTKLFVSFDL
jgi:hypothetical protein